MLIVQKKQKSRNLDARSTSNLRYAPYGREKTMVRICDISRTCWSPRALARSRIAPTLPGRPPRRADILYVGSICVPRYVRARVALKSTAVDGHFFRLECCTQVCFWQQGGSPFPRRPTNGKLVCCCTLLNPGTQTLPGKTSFATITALTTSPPTIPTRETSKTKVRGASFDV